MTNCSGLEIGIVGHVSYGRVRKDWVFRWIWVDQHWSGDNQSLGMLSDVGYRTHQISHTQLVQCSA